MKNHDNRLAVNRLFILGAGASLAASKIKTRSGKVPIYQSPLDSEFTARIEALDLQRPSWVSDAKSVVIDKFRADGYFTDHNLEQAIIRQLGLLNLFEAIHPRRSRKQIDSSDWLNQLSHIICIILRRVRENRDSMYGEIRAKYFPQSQAIKKQKNRIITFNYDTLLDTHFLKSWSNQQVYFSNIRDRRDRKSNSNFEHPLILKLHGSINWRCTEDDFKSIIEGPEDTTLDYEIGKIWVNNSSYPDPGDEISPLIMPPLPSKPITSIKLFKWLWSKAYEYLYEANELIIIGYSLPPTDNTAESMFGSFINSNLTRVVLVDPSTSALDRWRDVLSRNGFSNLRWTYYGEMSDFLAHEKV